MRALEALRQAVRTARARARGGRTEDGLRRLMLRGPHAVRRAVVHLLPQPEQFATTDVREAIVGGADLRLFPHEFIQWVHYFGWPDPNFESLACLARDARCLVDVGANVGIYSLRAAALNPQCRVLSVEAHPETFARLKENADRNPMLHIEALNLAVASEPGEVTLFDFDTEDSGFSSAVQREGLRATRKTVVKALPLDQIVREANAQPDLIKLDVEGYEPDVLAGAREVLTSYRPDIVLEWTPEWTVGREGTVARAVELLERVGYRMWLVPSLDAPRVKELPLAELRSAKGPQLNAVLSVAATMPTKLEAGSSRE